MAQPLTKETHNPIDWITAPAPVDYPAAVAFMEQRVAEIAAGQAPETIWLLEHPHLYTAGSSAQPQDLLCNDIPVFETGRGGQYTYHGPGQRVAYVMLDLKKRGGDIRKFVSNLETWLIATLDVLDVKAQRIDGRIGIWTGDPAAKIAALGLRVRKGISYHGIALNVDPDLRHFAGIVPCGLADAGVTSLAACGKTTDMAVVDRALKSTLLKIF